MPLGHRAQLVEGTEPMQALEHALAALKLQSDFVPAALIAARIYINRGEARRAMSLLRRVWRATSHPDIATLFANAVPGTSATDRLKRIAELVDSPPPNKASAIVLARASIDAFEWSAARNALASYSVANPSQGVCLLMAEIAKRNQVRIGDNEIEEALKELAEQSRQEVTRLRAEYKDPKKREMLIGMILENKVLELIQSKAVIEDAEG